MSNKRHSDSPIAVVYAQLKRKMTIAARTQALLNEYDWLVGDPGDPLKVICNLCNTKMSNERSTVEKHSISQKHKSISDVHDRYNNREDMTVDETATEIIEVSPDFPNFVGDELGNNDNATNVAEENISTEIHNETLQSEVRPVPPSSSFSTQENQSKPRSEIQVEKERTQGHKTFEPIPSTSSSFSSISSRLSNEEKKKEIKLAAFIAEHKISKKATEHLCSVLSSKDYALKIDHRRAEDIMKNVIGENEKISLANDLKNRKFSILIEEIPDVDTVKKICVVMRYYDSKIGKIVCRFWDLLQLLEIEEDIELSVLSLVIASLTKYYIPEDNVIGFAYDGGKATDNFVMMLQTTFPGITFIKCICHSINVCASEGCKRFPPECETLARAIYNYFKMNIKRTSEIDDLKKFHIFAETDVCRMLSPSQTQWISEYKVVDTILKNWDALKLFFQEYNECQEILETMSNPFIKAFYLFLHYILPKFKKANEYYQNEAMNITDISEKMEKFYSEILGVTMRPSYIESIKLDEIDPTNSFHWLDNILNDILKVKLQSVKKITEEKDRFQRYCFNFIETACVEIKRRYKFNDRVMNFISKCQPVYLLSTDNPSCLSSMFTLLPRLSPKESNQQVLVNEWKNFLSSRKTLSLHSTKEPDQFWHKVSQLAERDGTKKFKLLSEFMLNILSLPHSNAECERIFTEVHNTDPKIANDTTLSYILARQAISRKGTSCVDFEPDERMIARLS